MRSPDVDAGDVHTTLFQVHLPSAHETATNVDGVAYFGPLDDCAARDSDDCLDNLVKSSGRNPAVPLGLGAFGGVEVDHQSEGLGIRKPPATREGGDDVRARVSLDGPARKPSRKSTAQTRPARPKPGAHATLSPPAPSA